MFGIENKGMCVKSNWLFYRTLQILQFRNITMCTAMDEIKPSIHFIVNCLNIKQEMFGIVCLHELSSP